MAKRPVAQRPAVSPLPKSEVDAFNALIKQHHFSEAEERATALVRRYPKAGQAHLLHGQALLKQTRYREAEAAYREALRFAPNSLDALLGLAQSASFLGQHETALKLAQQARGLAPKQLAVWITLGNIQKAAYALEDAIASYYKALALAPNDWKAYRALAHLVVFKPDSAVFGVVKGCLADERNTPRDCADMHFVLGKAYLDLQDDEQAFVHFDEANRLMDESLPPIRAEIEKRLAFTRRRFTQALYHESASHQAPPCPQIIVAGMSRSGKSLVESLFRGVKGVTLAGEALILGEYTQERLALFDGKLDRYLAHLTPERLLADAEGYRARLENDGQIQVTTVPGDLWNLGLVGLWAPSVPIIFAVRNLLDLGVTGYFHQYQVPEGFRYSYNLEQLGRQIACSEKVMDHWAQVLPNPVYLVDYEALTADPEQVMGNLLGQLGLEREIPYADIVGQNAKLMDDISPIVSSDAPMPVTNRFNGFGERFRDKLQPLLKGYQTIADAFPRLAHPAVFDYPLPEHWRLPVVDASEGGQEDFDWQLKGSVTALDNGAYLLKKATVAPLLNTGALGVVAFDPFNEVTLDHTLQHHPNLQHVPHALLGSGQPSTLYACLEPAYSSTIKPLAAEQLPLRLQAPMRALTQYPINTVALDAIEGLTSVDWLILDARHDSMAVLEHGKQTLETTLLVHAKVLFQARYEQQPNLAELQHWAARQGFQFYRLVEFQYASSMAEKPELAKQPEATELSQASALFIPSPARLAALTPAQRQKLGFVLDTFYHIHDLTYQLLNESDPLSAEQYLRARDYYDHAKLDPPANELEEVAALLANGQPLLAGRYLTAWRQRYPSSASVRWLRAEAALLSHQDELAFIHMDKALQLAPDRLDLRAKAVMLLLNAEMWWEAWRLVEPLMAAEPSAPLVARVYAHTVVAHPAPSASAVQQAQHCIENQLNDDTIPRLERLTLKARVAALSGDHDTAMALHQQAHDESDDNTPTTHAWALLHYGHSLRLVGNSAAACDYYWKATQVVPHTRLTPTAAHFLAVALADADEYAPLVTLHKQWQELKQKYKRSAQMGRFGLPKQGLERMWLPGNRTSERRLAAYGLMEKLSPQAAVLDIQAEQGSLLMALAPHIGTATGLQESEFDFHMATAIAKALGESHLTFVNEAFENSTLRRTFDLILACGAHDSLDMATDMLGEKLYALCRDHGRVLLESRGTSNPQVIEQGFERSAQRIVAAGFSVEEEGTLCDDGLNLRAFKVLKKHA